MSNWDRSDTLGHILEADGREVCDHDHHCGEHTHVTDTVHDERLLCSASIRRNVVPETDQQVRGQAHAFPADEEDGVGVSQNQGQHCCDEQVQVGEETATILVMFHVGDCVHVNEGTNEGHQHHEGQRQRINQQAEVHAEIPSGDPGEQCVCHAVCSLISAQDLGDDDGSHDKGYPRGAGGQQMTPAVGRTTQQQQDRCACQRNCNHQPCQ
ncbi:Uncharacterised protein [Chlamydia trachomatis]|nr:Uncharacterised protein [Chlamydia trachomatis]